MRLRFFTSLIFMALAFVNVKSQPYNKDSLQKIIEQIRKRPADTAHIRLLREAGYSIIEKDSALSKALFEETLTKSLAVKDADAITNSYRMLGIWYMAFGNKDKALDLYRASLHSATSNNHYYLMAGAYFNIGIIKYQKGEYDSCAGYYLKAAEIFESPKVFEDKNLQPRVLDKKKSDLYYNISATFNTLKNLPKADEYIDKAIAIARSYKSTITIANYMQQKAHNFYENGDTEKALRIRLENVQELEAGNFSKTPLQGAYQNIAQEYFELGKMDSSEIFAQKSLRTAEELGITNGIANANWQLGRIATKEKKFKKAEEYLNKCSAYFLQSEAPDTKRSYYDVMSQLMVATGRYKEAYQYFKTYHDLTDTVLNSERTNQFSELEAKYQSEKKDSQIKLQQAEIQRKNTFNYILIGGAATLFIISLLSYRTYRQRQKLQKQRIAELETEKQLAATEAVLKGEEQERTRLAKDLHDGLGGMLSGIKYSLNTMKGNLVMTPENAQAFERSIDMLDSSIKEMRRVAHNMMPEALVKFGLDTALRDFCNDINQSGALKVSYQSIGLENAVVEQTTAITIYRIVQELLNNTIKHAAATQAIVQVSKADGLLSVTVEDDGRGFDTGILSRAKGIGWSNIQNRVEFLKGKLDVNSHKEKGTSVLIELPA
ncbi:MAG: sensor histidine kinase [Chitinophagaceae bacterium]|nr:sensor histidine kinase [Chitinophagaceae bacterium]